MLRQNPNHNPHPININTNLNLNHSPNNPNHDHIPRMEQRIRCVTTTCSTNLHFTYFLLTDPTIRPWGRKIYMALPCRYCYASSNAGRALQVTYFLSRSEHRCLQYKMCKYISSLLMKFRLDATYIQPVDITRQYHVSGSIPS